MQRSRQSLDATRWQSYPEESPLRYHQTSQFPAIDEIWNTYSTVVMARLNRVVHLLL